jgi:hypothetical protein
LILNVWSLRPPPPASGLAAIHPLLKFGPRPTRPIGGCLGAPTSKALIESLQAPIKVLDLAKSDDAPGGHDLDAVALFLDRQRRAVGWPLARAVLTALARFHRSKSFDLLQDQWLARTGDAPRALGIYRDQLQAAHWRQYTSRALAFIRAHPDLRGGQDILSPLLWKRSTDPDVLAAARVWLDHNGGLGLATPVLIALSERPMNRLT